MKSKLALAGALLCACLSFIAPAHAQSALEWVVSQSANATPLVSHGRRRAIDKLFVRRVLRSETGTGMLAGVTPALAAKAREIVSACGSVVISGRRHTRVAGSGHWSLHASGRAVDLRGNPGCIYARLRGWPGGYSTDYARVQHVHVSLGGREAGLRFAHGGQRHHRYAAR